MTREQLDKILQARSGDLSETPYPILLLAMAVHEKDAVQMLLKPCPSEWLAAVEVSTLVNSTRNNTAEVLERVGASGNGQPRGLFE